MTTAECRRSSTIGSRAAGCGRSLVEHADGPSARQPLLAAIDQTIVGTAEPRIIASLSGFDRYPWVATAYHC